MEEMRDKFLERAGELWSKHEKEFSEVIEESESKKINLAFSAKLDFSESSAVLETKISFSQVMSDGAADTFDDPNQPPLSIEVMEETKVKRVRKAKVFAVETIEAVETAAVAE